ncbi:MAG: endonuclease III [Porphyromonas sp.]|nr:endonuclease III [Porphyromonas sp.]
MTIKERYKGVMAWFEEHRTVVETELEYNTPFQLLVAVVLSAQCTDKRVNVITKELFAAFPTAEEMALAREEVIFEYIRTCSYPNSKAKYLVGLSKMLVEEYGGTIPEDPKELVKLPGVGRKTANVILSIIYDQPRIAVDTHVYRVSKRIGLAPQTANTPLKVEMALMRHIPEEFLGRAHHWLILHGRYICTARSPKCPECGLRPYCRYHARHAIIHDTPRED